MSQLKPDVVRKTPVIKVRRKAVNPFQSKASAKSAESVARIAASALRAIRANYHRTAFTRDDVLALVSKMRLDSKQDWAVGAYGINDVATGTRYRKVCDAIQFLVANGDVIALDWLRLCLPEVKDELTNAAPSHSIYLASIRRLIRSHFKSEQSIDVMAVVYRWRSDQHLPENLKRMTVRRILPILWREGILRRDDEDRFIVV